MLKKYRFYKHEGNKIFMVKEFEIPVDQDPWEGHREFFTTDHCLVDVDQVCIEEAIDLFSIT